jgi:hypothetical protein
VSRFVDNQTNQNIVAHDAMATAANIIDGEMAERMVAENNKLAARKAVRDRLVLSGASI